MPGSSAPAARLTADGVTLGYGGDTAVVHRLSLDVLVGRVTSIIGPNGCGKSTLLRALVRLLRPRGGTVLLDGQAIHRLPTKQVARQLGLLAQQSETPDLVTVEELARRGRYPHQQLFQPPSRQDEAAVERALELAGVADLRDRPVDELSGGQRQRAWLAMALAQDTPILLLDEPTTFLDIAHQQEVLALVRRLNRDEGRSVVLVLHDVNDAASVSDHIVAMRDGVVAAEGSPLGVVTPPVLERVFGVACDVVRHPESGTPVSVPRGRVFSARNGSTAEPFPCLRAERLSSGYGRRRVIHDATLALPRGRISVIIGPNACGKSTLLKTFARLLPLQEGGARLLERPLREGSAREYARKLAMLAQGPVAPPGVLAEDLVAAGRYPYQRWYRQWSVEDQHAVEASLAATELQSLRLRAVDTLSGGQRQRVWLALALAQQTPVLLLDEPTTFLDIAHQVEVLDLVRDLNEREGRSVVMVLHDLGQACRYADHVVVMHEGHIVAAGDPRHVITEPLVQEVFGVPCRIVPDPFTGRPLVLPSALPSRPMSAVNS